jgi:membrane protein implicated in regulation of membrane protease activity
MLLAAWLWRKWLECSIQAQQPANHHLNQRGQRLVGCRFILETDLVNGRGHMHIGDCTWPVSTRDDLSAGTLFEVVAVEGITLIIRALSH